MTQQVGDSESVVREICTTHVGMEGALVPILQAIQARIGYIPDEAIQTVASELNLSRAEVFGVVSFYHDFHRKPRAGHTLRVCRAEACQSVGGRELWSTATTAAEQTGADIDVEAVYCLGNCACAPAVQFDGRTLGRMDVERVSALFTQAGNGAGAVQ